jgi:predicted DNA-binding protein (UPF0251 family)
MRKRKEAPSSLGPDGKRSRQLKLNRPGSVRRSPTAGSQYSQGLMLDPPTELEGKLYDPGEPSRSTVPLDQPYRGKDSARVRRARAVADLSKLVSPRRSTGSPRWEWKPGRERQDKRIAEAVAKRIAARAEKRRAEKALDALRDAGATERQILAFKLVNVDGLTQREAARVMGVAQKNVAKLLKKLESKLGGIRIDETTA